MRSKPGGLSAVLPPESGARWKRWMADSDQYTATESLQVRQVRRGGAEHSPGSVTGMGQVPKSRAKWGIRNKSCSGNRL